MKRLLFALVALAIAIPAAAQWPGYTSSRGGGGGASSATAASPYGTDNRVIRSDGTGRGTQATGITVDDSDNVTGVNDLAVGGAVTVTGNLTAANLTAAGTLVDGMPCVYESTGPLLNCNVALTSTQAPGGSIIAFRGTATNPTDGLVVCSTTGLSFTTCSAVRFYAPRAGTITRAYCSVGSLGTLGDTAQGTIAIRLNDTTDTTISAVVQFDAIVQAYNNTALNIVVAQGEFFNLKVTHPTWNTTNATITTWDCSLWYQ